MEFQFGREGAAAGHGTITFDFTDVAEHACTLHGYPGAAVVDGSTTVLNAVRTLNGFRGDDQWLTNVPVVVLQPGQTASAVLEWADDNDQPCYTSGQGLLEVTAPNTTRTVTASSNTWKVGGPGGICSGFEIHPVVAGPLA